MAMSASPRIPESAKTAIANIPTANVGSECKVPLVAQRKIETPTTVAGQRCPERANLVVLVETDFPGSEERVPLTGHRDVLGPIQPKQDRAARDGCSQRGDSGESVRLELFASEAASHSQTLDSDVVRGDA